MRRSEQGVDYGTPLNEYLCTEYPYHCICLSCGAVRHDRPGAFGECRACGGDSHRIGMGCTPDIAAPWYVQYLDPTCPTCRKTLARLGAFDQMELFGEAA